LKHETPAETPGFFVDDNIFAKQVHLDVSEIGPG